MLAQYRKRGKIFTKFLLEKDYVVISIFCRKLNICRYTRVQLMYEENKYEGKRSVRKKNAVWQIGRYTNMVDNVTLCEIS